jgi:predicted small metal-binding protein
MVRKYIDCREHPSDIKCSVALAADSKEELLEAAMQHLKNVHKYEDTPDVRKKIQEAMRDGTPLK